MAQIQNERLLLFSAGASSTPVSAGHFAINPVIDLAASAGEDNVLYLWRPNDDMVSKHTERNRKIEAIKWKEDGKKSCPKRIHALSPWNCCSHTCRRVFGGRLERRGGEVDRS